MCVIQNNVNKCRTFEVLQVIKVPIDLSYIGMQVCVSVVRLCVYVHLYVPVREVRHICVCNCLFVFVGHACLCDPFHMTDEAYSTVARSCMCVCPSPLSNEIIRVIGSRQALHRARSPSGSELSWFDPAW